MNSDGGYSLVRLRNGAHSVRSLEHGETMHPGLGPAAEGAMLYVDQLRLVGRLSAHRGEFVVWDVGLGAAANVLAVLRAVRGVRAALRILSFDQTLAPLQFAYSHRQALGFFEGYEQVVEELLHAGQVRAPNGCGALHWELREGNFPMLACQAQRGEWGRPSAILFDPWSPAKNPAMWTAPLLADLYRLSDPEVPCALPTYSRSTMLRVGLLLAGFWVGIGCATGQKEETTLAANRPEWIERPLDRRWLERATRSRAAEPMWVPVYRQAPLSAASTAQLQQHPQFQ